MQSRLVAAALSRLSLGARVQVRRVLMMRGWRKVVIQRAAVRAYLRKIATQSQDRIVRKK